MTNSENTPEIPAVVENPNKSTDTPVTPIVELNLDEIFAKKLKEAERRNNILFRRALNNE